MYYLAKNLKLLREHARKTQVDIALLVNKGQTTITNWEKGKSRPNIEELVLLSNFFDITLDTFLKVDIAKTSILSIGGAASPGNTVYKPNDSSTFVRDEESTALTRILQEIKSLREEWRQGQQELQELKKKLPGHTPKKAASGKPPSKPGRPPAGTSD